MGRVGCRRVLYQTCEAASGSSGFGGAALKVESGVGWVYGPRLCEQAEGNMEKKRSREQARREGCSSQRGLERLAGQGKPGQQGRAEPEPRARARLEEWQATRSAPCSRESPAVPHDRALDPATRTRDGANAAATGSLQYPDPVPLPRLTLRLARPRPWGLCMYMYTVM